MTKHLLTAMIAALLVVGCKAGNGKAARQLSEAGPTLDGLEQHLGDSGAGNDVGACVPVKPDQCAPYLMFQGPAGEFYVGSTTACVLGSSYQEVAWTLGAGPVAIDETGERLGEFLYAISDAASDYALVQLDPDVFAGYETCSDVSGSEHSQVVLYYDRGTPVGHVRGIGSDDSRIFTVSVTEDGSGEGAGAFDIVVDTPGPDLPPAPVGVRVPGP